jgi:replicative DNA helicase
VPLPSWDELGEPPDPADGWPELIPLGDGRDRPPFPLDALPAWVRAQVVQVADEMQFPADLPAMLSMTALSIVTAGRVEVHIQGTWVEGTNTYGVTAMKPGAGKSPAFKRMLGPISDWEHELCEAANVEAEIVDTKRKIIQKALQRAIDKGETAEALALGDELRAMPEVIAPRLMAEDATPERLIALIGEQGGRLALTSTEGGPFQMMVGRYSDKANLDVYLQAWSGDDIRVDRVNRPTIIVRNPRLTIGLTVQPSVIEALADSPELQGRGLVARFMYSIPDDWVGTRDMRRASTWDQGVEDAYGRRLLDIAHALAGDGLPATLTLDADASAAFLDWRQDHEERMRDDGDLYHLREWVTKLQSTTARLAALITVAEDHRRTTISGDVMRRAITVGNYWEAHARLAHDLWGGDPTLRLARLIVGWLEREGIERFTMRDVYSAHRRAMPRASDAVEPLELLVEKSWIRREDDGELVAGRRGVASPQFTVSPRLATEGGNHARMRAMCLETKNSSISLFLPEGGNTEKRAHGAHDTHDPKPEVIPNPPTDDPDDITEELF